MIEYAVETVEVKTPKSITCDVCEKKYIYDEDDMEIQEFQIIRSTGGYGSVFGDGAEVKLDICQHCLDEKLGIYMVVKED